MPPLTRPQLQLHGNIMVSSNLVICGIRISAEDDILPQKSKSSPHTLFGLQQHWSHSLVLTSATLWWLQLTTEHQTWRSPTTLKRDK